MPSDEELYQLALDEIVQKRVIKATFSKAFALADGEDNRTRAAYIRLRVSQLAEEAILERKKKVEEAARLRANEDELKRRESEARRKAAVALTDEHARQIEAMKELEAHFVQRFGTSVHVVDEARKFNADVPLRRLLAKSDSFSPSAIYYDKAEHRFLPLEQLFGVVSH